MWQGQVRALVRSSGTQLRCARAARKIHRMKQSLQRSRSFGPGVPFLLMVIAVTGSAAAAPTDDEVVLREGLVIAPGGRSGRSATHTDPVELLIVSGKWATPKAGDTVPVPGGSARTWESIAADDKGNFAHRSLAGGYLCCTVLREQAGPMILEAAGHGMVYVNGEPRVGDPYQHGYVRVPVQLRQGANELLFQGGRGQVRAKLVPVTRPVQFDSSDPTLPDLIVGSEAKLDAAIIVSNATDRSISGLAIESMVPGNAPQRSQLPPLLPFGTRKVAFRIVAAAPQSTGDCDVQLRLIDEATGAAAESLDSTSVKLRVLDAGSTHKRTFVSSIDGSVQYFAVVPEKKSEAGAGAAAKSPPALILTLHGAGVEALGQAACYSPKPGVVTVAPTNRRPFGFDWEDWGRLDAIEVLELAQRQFGTDPQRTYLTGHSMGGHGVWHLGVTFPDRFAAIGPSAGWVSMFSYAGARRQTAQEQDSSSAKLSELMSRCMSPSDTLALARNYLHHGVYVLHGEKDDNVPVAQARTMKQQLGEMHHDFDYYEEPGAGHWWGKDLAEYSSDGATWGTACVDWPPMFRFFVRHTIPAADAVTHVEFFTASPGVSSRSHWATVEAQPVQLRPSTVRLDYDPATHRFSGETSNVARLSLDVTPWPSIEPFHVALDGQNVANVPRPQSGKIRLVRESDAWKVSTGESKSLKGPERYGTFKAAFRDRMLFVYGTAGESGENAWSFAKARYDAEQFWYRGNGSIDVIPDTAFDADPSRFADRNVVLYGNADTNAAWARLLADSPVQVRRGRVQVGDRAESGDGLASLLVRPRAGSDRSMVVAIVGTGLPGMRLTDRIPYFTSGVAFPDLTILGVESLADGAIRAAGFFGIDWGVNSGEILWREGAAGPSSGD
jgi:dienelactone hydrolase